MNTEIEQRRIVDGICDLCQEEPAKIIFNGVKICYKCWIEFWTEYVKSQREER